MRRTRTRIVTLAVGVLLAASFAAMASWQGTWRDYDDERVLPGQWPAGGGAADGRWGEVTENRSVTQGCAVSE